MAHGAEDHPFDPDAAGRGHEINDVAARPILIFLIGLVVFGGLVQISMSALMIGYVAEDTKAAVPDMDLLSDSGNTNAPPPLQHNTTEDMFKMYREEDAVLTTYAVNPKTKAIRVPLDRAIALVAKKGLPHRDKAPKLDSSGELPYPNRATPYKASN